MDVFGLVKFDVRARALDEGRLAFLGRVRQLFGGEPEFTPCWLLF
jgi:hypothetical protein